MSGVDDESTGAEESSRENAAHDLLALFGTPDAMQRWLNESFYVKGEWDGGDGGSTSAHSKKSASTTSTTSTASTTSMSGVTIATENAPGKETLTRRKGGKQPIKFFADPRKRQKEEWRPAAKWRC
jgi:hypothetical protein